MRPRLIHFLLGFVLVLPFFVFVGCKTETKKEPLPREIEERSLPVESSEEPEAYRPPDGGFGALDHTRDIRSEAEAKQRESEQALEATE